jgi:hypothetical protein
VGITLEFWREITKELYILTIEIRQAGTEEDNAKLDQFLWEVLWEPLGFDRDVRGEFNLDRPT